MTVYGYYATNESREYTHVNSGYFGLFLVLTIEKRRLITHMGRAYVLRGYIRS